MNWKLKAHTLAILSRLPGGRRVYHRAQRLAGTTALSPHESVRRSLEIVALAREAGADPTTGAWLEVGTGWRPFLPFILYLIGCDRVVTVDVNPWMTAQYASETYEALEGQLETIAAAGSVSAASVRSRYQNASRAKGQLDTLLDACKIEYRCPGDAGATDLAEGSIDFVCSSNVLEHIPPGELGRIHRESFRVLRAEGLAVHRLNPQDHFSHVDSSITGANFLRFSPEQWRWYGGTGLAYHNRLRCRQQETLLKDAGFAIRVNRVRNDPASVAAITSGTLPIHPDFAGFSPEELAADYMWLVGAKAVAATTAGASNSRELCQV